MALKKQSRRPTITDFTGAQHDHADADSAGQVSHTDLTNKGTNTHAQLDTLATDTAAHVANTVEGVHGSASAATASALMHRDASGRAKVGAPVATDDIARKLEVDAVQTNLTAHTTNVTNPHSVTKSQVGLANVDNTSDAAKPVSTAQQAALDGKQNLDSDLTAIAAIAPLNDDVIQRKAGAWTNRTMAQVKTDLVLVKGDVGLANVDNTSDAAKPVSTAQQAALDGKQNLDSDLTAIAAIAPLNDDVIQRKAGAWTNRTMAQVKTDLVLVKGDVGLGNVDNTSDAAKPVSTAQQAALDLKAALTDLKITLLKANSGIDTTVAEHSVDTVAISGLDAKDTIEVVFTLQQITQAGLRFLLRNSTDGINIGSNVPGATINIGSFVMGKFTLRQSQEGNTSVVVLTMGDGNGEAATVPTVTQHTFTTPWTGSWTLDLRSLGQTSGGTEKWAWAVHKVKGT